MRTFRQQTRQWNKTICQFHLNTLQDNFSIDHNHTHTDREIHSVRMTITTKMIDGMDVGSWIVGVFTQKYGPQIWTLSTVYRCNVCLFILAAIQVFKVMYLVKYSVIVFIIYERYTSYEMRRPCTLVANPLTFAHFISFCVSLSFTSSLSLPFSLSFSLSPSLRVCIYVCFRLSTSIKYNVYFISFGIWVDCSLASVPHFCRNICYFWSFW